MIAVLQWTVSSVPDKNLAYLRQELNQLRYKYKNEELLVCLPEGFACFDAEPSELMAFAHASQPFIREVCGLAKEYNVWLSAGTIPIGDGDKYYAASLLIDSSGELVARYNKIHLFDVDVNDSKKNYRESNSTKAGKELVVVDTPFGKIGLTVCYDMRFPGLFSALRARGADIILVPSAFTVPTGKAHWLPLLQARAIENQVFIVAAATTGTHDRRRETYGHSVVISPWGEIEAMLATEPNNIVYLPNMDKLTEIRQNMPLMSHNQFNYEFKHEQ
ncbi:carbon-nitrogen hydrolase family protein [Pseudoalteromonas sp. SSM20]|uniref:carbon-nitrogen hydrolase family protein n=1 Tax=Pseudoalteromonas sp. SSM20 TaxID=3139394 RepID=UPI003BAC01A5